MKSTLPGIERNSIALTHSQEAEAFASSRDRRYIQIVEVANRKNHQKSCAIPLGSLFPHIHSFIHLHQTGFNLDSYLDLVQSRQLLPDLAARLFRAEGVNAVVGLVSDIFLCLFLPAQALKQLGLLYVHKAGSCRHLAVILHSHLLGKETCVSSRHSMA